MLALLARGDRRLSEALLVRDAGDAPPGPGGLVGLELEFSVRSGQGRRIHFGSLIHRLALEGAPLDPADPNAYRCPWGGVITCDGAEAEIATPPVWTRPGFTGELQAWSGKGEAALHRALPQAIHLEGYSAHLSAAMPARLNDRVCRLYAERFAAGLMLLTDWISSPGLLVRPRPGRTELCCEFVTGETLLAAAAFVAGTTKACAAAIRGQGTPALLPPRLEVHLVPAVRRYGWYVDRRAFGTDLHAACRRSLLPRASGGTISAQSYLELAWAAARQALAGDAAPADLQAAEAMITGHLPLPTEHSQPADPRHGQPDGTIRFDPGRQTARSTPALPLGAHTRPGFTVRPVIATWDFTVFETTSPARQAYACIPRSSLPRFTDALDRGALDGAMGAYLAHPSRRRVLSAHQQTRRPGLYDRLGAPAALLAPERDPITGRREPAGAAAKHTGARPGKRQRHDDHTPRRLFRLSRIAAVIGAAVIILLAAAGAATALLTHGSRRKLDNSGSPTAPLVTFRPAALSFAKVLVNDTAIKPLTITNPAGVKRMVITGPAADDFSIQDVPDPPGGRGQNVQRATQLPQKCLANLHPGHACRIDVTFTPSVTGPVTANLSFYLGSRPQPHNVSLNGTGIKLGQSPLVSVTGISPARGPIAGGTHVTITGSGLTDATGVYFGTIKAPAFTGNSATQITATSPPGTGTVNITVTTPKGQSGATHADLFSYTSRSVTGAPTVTAISPATGPIAGGTHVTITGSGLTGATSVHFGSVEAPVTGVISDTEITTTSPASASPDTVDITVTTPKGQSAPTDADQFSYVTPPAVLGLRPGDGPTTGGTNVTIFGRGLTGATSVYFGGVEAPVTAVISDTQITTTSPASASPGTVSITVVTPGGRSPPNLNPNAQFRYFAPPPTVTHISPDSGSAAGGTSVTIFGAGFTGATSVSFGGTPAIFHVISDREIMATSPAGSGTVDITVTTPGGTSPTNLDDRFTYV